MAARHDRGVATAYLIATVSMLFIPVLREMDRSSGIGGA
jgi:hypothetical protein